MSRIQKQNTSSNRQSILASTLLVQSLNIVPLEMLLWFLQLARTTHQIPSAFDAPQCPRGRVVTDIRVGKREAGARQ